jgi:hypothetical protein
MAIIGTQVICVVRQPLSVEKQIEISMTMISGYHETRS